VLVVEQQEHKKMTSQVAGESTGAGRTSRLRALRVYLPLVIAALYSFWPIMVMALEGYNIDLAAVIAGKSCRFVGGVQVCITGVYPTPIHYLDALFLNGFPRLLVNTTAIAAVSIAVALAAGVASGYALARVRLFGRGAVAYMLLALRAVSPFIVVVPLYILYTRDGLWDTYIGAGLAEELAVLSVVVWMLRGFFSDIPREIYEAASMFGASEGQIFKRVALRMVVPGLLVTVIFAFVLIWNDFVISDVLTGPASKTVAVGVWSGMGENSLAFQQVSWDDLNAAGFLSWVPAVVLMMTIRKYLAKGYTLGLAGRSG
jgi:multiple sugar transport system permease protein